MTLVIRMETDASSSIYVLCTLVLCVVSGYVLDDIKDIDLYAL